ncbi:MAG: 4-hydroxythreonine-4-phosphate dehydrogenase PdxA [Alphaproteobacteria bacterium]|nr:4-hydroxythreonine-4-phosphate dehydrogenase PdxA [Alphaproteobacteria bacterium]
MPSSIINRPLAVSLGEPAGIGGEIILKSWRERSQRDIPVFFVVGSIKILIRTARELGLDIPVTAISSPDKAAEIFPYALPVIDLDHQFDHQADFDFGTPSRATAALVIRAIETATDLVLTGKAAGLVTAPIQKSILYDVGFTFPGHTEYLAHLCQQHGCPPAKPVMMLVSDQLRVVPLTIHIALADVARKVTPELLRDSCLKTNAALIQDFGIQNPRLAVAGLNPHAGEEGGMGAEDQLVIRPTLDKLRQSGLTIVGPLPADTLFHADARTGYDAAICMYHDQALIPIKTLDFDGGVNVTLGLPMVRTSPDHGTALNIAGKAVARPHSMIRALKLARHIWINRQKVAPDHV